ncbi:MAG: hypothetical protein IPH18_18090 [Chitinophagaceae bacterium]|nr:hypothetical protein [Chitinophagaceae bacterium]
MKLLSPDNVEVIASITDSSAAVKISVYNKFLDEKIYMQETCRSYLFNAASRHLL